MSDSGSEPRVIFHVDMDAFFASVEQLDDPRLRGKPVIVGADPRGGRGRGVVSAASYEARRFGIGSAMPISKAFRLCPNGAYVRPRFERYEAVSERIMSLLSERAPVLEPAGLDEAYLDMTGTGRLSGPPREAAAGMKAAIREAEGLTASIGIGRSKMIAKIASDLKKPDGLVEVPDGETAAFLEPLPVGRIPGVGPATRESLRQCGLLTVGDLQRVPETGLVRLFGSAGAWLRECAFGRDDSPVTPEREIQSVSNETTFDEDTADPDLVHDLLLDLSERVGLRLRRAGMRGRTVELKIRFDDFETRTRRITLDRPTDLSERIFASAEGLARPFLGPERKIRLLGIGVSGLCADAGGQADLFASSEESKRNRLNRAADALRDKFGDDIVIKAAGKD
jgi:nucleotidyltransferase/DNA polymerase involved in DNA repair